MNRFSRFSKIAFVLIFSLISLQNMFVGSLVSVAHAADCSITGPATQLSIYSTDKPSPYPRPDSNMDPQILAVGEMSIRMEVEIEDANGCPVVTDPATTRVSLTITAEAGDLLTPGGANQGETYNFTISKMSLRGGFFVKGKALANASLTAVTRLDSDVQLTSGTQTINFIAPAPKPLYGITNFKHGTQDTIQGDAGAIAKAGVVSGIKVRAYSDLAGTMQIGTDVLAASDGSFPTIETGDDQYRTIFLRAVYPGTAPVLSDELTVAQFYPYTLTELKVTRGSNDRPSLSWPAADPADEITFAAYRTLASAPAFTDPPLAIVVTPNFEDTSALLGVKYRYAVKQIYEESYTPEFLPVADIRIDLSNVIFAPAGSITNVTKPTITFTVTPDLFNQWSLANEVIKAQYINTVTNAVYTSTVAVTDPALFTMMASGPYLDSVGASLPSLPDGSYTSKLVADDSILVAPNVPLGIMDAVTNVVTYSIDSVLPTAPLLSKLRYSNSVLFGLAGAVEANVFVDAYSSASLTPANKLGSTMADANGAFQLMAMSIPTGGIFYLTTRDATGNLSPATMFDVVTLPIAPVASKLMMEMNKPGVVDRIIGGAGAVAGLATVRIFGADPALNPGLVPLYEFLANSDGSFTQSVGDNQAGAFWVAVWNGAGNLSSAVKLSNITVIAAPASFTAIGGDNAVTLYWDLVSGASYYTIAVYNITTKQNLTTATVSGTQSSLRLTLVNNNRYRFYIHAVDATGNISLPREIESTSSAARVVYAVATIREKPVEDVAEPARSPVISKVAPSRSKVIEEEALPLPPATPTPEPETRDWTTWLIVGLGVILLGLAWFFGRQLWSIDSSETVVTTIKKTDVKKKSTALDKKNEAEKPRW